MVINWTKQAQDSLADIYNFYLPQVGSEKAKNIVSHIARMPKVLTTFPGIGSVVTTAGGKQYRQLVKKRYKLFYSIEEDMVFIHLVWDSRRNPQTLSDLLNRSETLK